MITSQFVRSTLTYPDFLYAEGELIQPSEIINVSAQATSPESLDLILRLAGTVKTEDEFVNIKAISMTRVGIHTADGVFVGSDLWWLVVNPQIVIAVDCNDPNYVCTLELPDLYELQVTGVNNPTENDLQR